MSEDQAKVIHERITAHEARDRLAHALSILYALPGIILAIVKLIEVLK